MLYNSGSVWPSVVVHEHWPVSQRMIVEMGDYAWSEHIVTVFLACQITIKNVQVQLTVKGKTTQDSYTPTPKSSCALNVVVLKWSVSLAPNPCRPSVGRNKKRLSSDQWTRLHVRIIHPKLACDQSNRAWRWRNVNCGRFMGRRARIPWWWRRLITVRVLMWPPNYHEVHQLYWTAVASPIWISADPLSASFCEVYLHVDGQQHSPFDENAASVVQCWND